jgi:predicted Fe-Mo cluster-binding NifX family protein
MGSNATVDLPRLAPEQKGVALAHALTEVGADVVMPVRMGPSAVGEVAFGILVRSTRRLDHTVQRHKL